MDDLLNTGEFIIEPTYDPAKLLRLSEDGYDLVINYTCFAQRILEPRWLAVTG